jgi:polar amino acid transport system substrate-binding protein
MPFSNIFALVDSIVEMLASIVRPLVLGGVLAFCLPLGAAERTVFMPVLQAKPFGWIDADGQAQGLYPDIAAALARQTGLTIQVDVVPFARAAAMVASGSADATMMFRTAFTQGKVVEASMVFHTHQVVQMRPGLKVAGRGALANLDLGRMNGGCQELGDDHSIPWRFQELSSQESGVRMLLAARIDGFCTVNESLLDVLSSTGLSSEFSQAQRLVLASKPVWLMLSQNLAPDLRKRLVRGIEELQKSGEMARIFRSRLGSRYVLHLDK